MLNLDLLLKQKIHISNELIQSLKILTMSKLDLENFLEKESEENVMIELEDAFKNEIFISDLKNYEKKSICNSSYDFNNVNSKQTSIEDYLIFQLIEKSLSYDEENIIKYLIYSLDSRGYLDIDLEKVADKLYMPLSLVQYCQKILTTFDPKGIGALNLRECLLAQIQTTNKNLTNLIEKHLETLYKNDYDMIMEDLKLKPDELLELIRELEELNPNPKSSFDDKKYEKLIIPEIFIELNNDKIDLRVEKYNPIKLNQHYLELLETNIDDKTKAYLRNKLARTLLIKDSIDKINQTIENISTYLVNFQKDYFLKNLPLKPINQEDLAKTLNISTSTVSRAVREKYIQSPIGILSIQDLFSTSTVSNTVSKDYIQTIIRLLIKEENKSKPLSDEDIKKKLNNMEISITRRTVQKYRDLLNIPSSYKRRKIYYFNSLK